MLFTYGLWSEKQNMLLQHMHKKEFWTLINERENNLKHENEAKELLPLSLVFVFNIISTFINQNPKFSFMHVLTKDVLLL